MPYPMISNNDLIKKNANTLLKNGYRKRNWLSDDCNWKKKKDSKMTNPGLAFIMTKTKIYLGLSFWRRKTALRIEISVFGKSKLFSVTHFLLQTYNVKKIVNIKLVVYVCPMLQDI